jgi:hypothetical protein
LGRSSEQNSRRLREQLDTMRVRLGDAADRATADRRYPNQDYEVLDVLLDELARIVGGVS